MATPVIMPRQGQSVESCILTEWKVNVGDQVAEGDVLAVIETDKASFDLESTAAGTVQDRKYGTTTFGLDRFINGFLDLATLAVMGKFGRRPMHFFGAAGTLMFTLSIALLAYLGGYKLWALSAGIEAVNFTIP